MGDPAKLAVLLLLYASVFLVAWYDKRTLDRAERRTFGLLWGIWSVAVVLINYLGSLLGVITFIPWINNVLHAGVWVGIVLTYLFLALRRLPIAVQFIAVAFFSLMVRLGEFALFGLWDHPHFLWAFRGTEASLVGWSFVDGFIPLIDLALLAVLRRKVPGLIPGPGGFREPTTPA
ncbi:MAG: hypothetical protein GWM92_04390 [Gemmatimonadetes bacterium]|nr:hypothetical protein [Gemmatimonadota bacterium]NIR77816.1 hypothetical protein [Gemmatimonadota bacterium]NIT86355.1 hypothetical protein [Gemmatimonadota bacterium]NIU30189.1 hypothetical protein [Gemmatimonadota bacterium]NIU35106.1 hypothetical protein [Gemmatimonadota bacterium]